MSDAIFIVIALLFEFVGPVLLAGLAVWRIWKFVRMRRLRASLRAAKGDAAALRMEHARIGAGALSFLGWASFPVAFVAALGLGMEWEYALFCAGLCGGAILYGAQRLKSRYNQDFKEKVVRAELEKVFENLYFQPDGGLNEDVLRSSGLLPPGDISCNDLITARYHGLDFAQCDIRIQDSAEVAAAAEDDGEARREVLTDVFQGRVMRFAMASRAGGPVRVLRRDFGAARALADSGDWQRVETELATFGERFEVFARDPLDAMRVMTPLMIEGIYYLDGKLDVPLAFHFENGEMLVFMALTRDAFDVSGKKTLLEERKLLEEDISLITGFLDTMHFKRGEKSTAAEEKRENTGEAVALAAAAGVAGFSLAARLSRLGMGLHGPMRLACKLVFWLPAAIWGISVVVAFLNLPDGVALSFSITDGATELSDPCNTLAFIAVGAIFVLPSALLVGNILGKTLNVFFLGAGQGVSYGGRILQLFKSFVAALFAGIPLWLHLLFISINLDALQAI